MLQRLWEFGQVNPWPTKFIPHPRLVRVRPHGQECGGNKPPAGPMNADEYSVSRLVAPVGNLNVSPPG